MQGIREPQEKHIEERRRELKAKFTDTVDRERAVSFVTKDRDEKSDESLESQKGNVRVEKEGGCLHREEDHFSGNTTLSLECNVRQHCVAPRFPNQEEYLPSRGTLTWHTLIVPLGKVGLR